jgi:succinate dehydrogenase/fumarate reductase iron-sulfur protein
MSKTMKIIVRKYDPSANRNPYDVPYKVPLKAKSTILDGLIYIYENLDPDCAFEYGCRYDCCGSCAVKVDGIPKLICHELLQKDIHIEPLDHFPVIRDLVIDKSNFFSHLAKYQPFFTQSGLRNNERPDVLDPREFERFKVTSRCISCLCCNSQCSLINNDGEFEGPAFFILLARFLFDPRDNMVRADIFKKADLCTECGECDAACPKEIPITEIMRAIKSD